MIDVQITKYTPVYDKVVSVAFYKELKEVTYETQNLTVDGTYIDVIKPIWKDPETVYTIDCPTSGPKPNISIEYKEVEGTIVYDVILTIKNAGLNSADIQYFNRMVITAGYSNQIITIDSPIMYAYSSSPPPDNSIVFGGITVGHINYNTQVNCVINENDSVTLGVLITSLTSLVGFTVDTPNGLPNSVGEFKKNICPEFQLVWDLKWQGGQFSKLFTSPIQLFNWLGDTLSEYGKNIGVNIYEIITESRFCIGIYNEETIVPSSLKNEIIYLNNIKSASFSGPILTVTSPWVPSMRPFSIFCMPPTFYQTRSLLVNMTDHGLQKGTWNLYRAITVNVQFSTVENQNQMTILARPLTEVNTTQKTEVTERPQFPVVTSYITFSIHPAFSTWFIQGISEFPYQTSRLGLSIFDNEDYEIEYDTKYDNYDQACYKHYKEKDFYETTVMTIVEDESSVVQYLYFEYHILWPLVVQLTYDKGEVEHELKNPLSSYKKGDTLMFPIFEDDNIFTSLIHLDTLGKVRQLYLNWIAVMLNWNIGSNSTKYDGDIRICCQLYRSLSIAAGNDEQIVIKNNTISVEKIDNGA